jgi:hypothetical protein
MNKVGKYKRFRQPDNSGVVRPTFTVTKQLANSTAIVFTIQSNLINRTINWQLDGPVAAEFVDTLGLANTVVLDSNGRANVVKVINTSPYAANGNVYGNTSITMNVRPGGVNADVLASNTAQINRTVNTPPVVTGGTTTLSGNIRFHTFSANGTLAITNVGNNSTGSNAANIQAIIVGAGGRSGFQAGDFPSPPTTFRAGHGGGGGVIPIDQLAVIGSYPIAVGTSTSAGSNPSSFYGQTALAGGDGGSSSFGSVLAGASGGSGGGGAWSLNFATGVRTRMPGGDGTPGQGNRGGDAPVTDAGAGGGAGGSASSSTPGIGYTWIDGVAYARGGGLPAATPITPGTGGRCNPPAANPATGQTGIVKIGYTASPVPTRTISL